MGASGTDNPGVEARIASRETISASGLMRVTLEMPASYSFLAGQYLSVLHSNGSEIPLSIASAPAGLPTLELHFQPTSGDLLSNAMEECLAEPSLKVSIANGEVRCPESATSLTIIAGGSGASLAFSCVSQRGTSNASNFTQVLWCVAEEEELYALDVLGAYCTLHQVVDARRDSDNEALTILPDLPKTDQYILSGSPSFVYTMTDVLAACNIGLDQMQSDVYAYAPRETPFRNI